MISVPWQCGQCRTCMIMTSLDWVEGCSDSRTPEEHSRPTPLKHLQCCLQLIAICNIPPVRCIMRADCLQHDTGYGTRTRRGTTEHSAIFYRRETETVVIQRT